MAIRRQLRDHHRHRPVAFSTDFKRPTRIPAHLDMQLEAHRIEYSKNCREVRLLWIACKRTTNACPRNPRFLRKVRNIVKVGGRANGMTDFGNIRFLERFIYEIGSRASRSRLWASCEPDRFFGHGSLQQNRPAFLPAYCTGDYAMGRDQYRAATGAP